MLIFIPTSASIRYKTGRKLFAYHPLKGGPDPKPCNMRPMPCRKGTGGGNASLEFEWGMCDSRDIGGHKTHFEH